MTKAKLLYSSFYSYMNNEHVHLATLKDNAISISKDTTIWG